MTRWNSADILRNFSCEMFHFENVTTFNYRGIIIDRKHERTDKNAKGLGIMKNIG